MTNEERFAERMLAVRRSAELRDRALARLDHDRRDDLLWAEAHGGLTQDETAELIAHIEALDRALAAGDEAMRATFSRPGGDADADRT